jgi:hypothetical protein
MWLRTQYRSIDYAERSIFLSSICYFVKLFVVVRLTIWDYIRKKFFEKNCFFAILTCLARRHPMSWFAYFALP